MRRNTQKIHHRSSVLTWVVALWMVFSLACVNPLAGWFGKATPGSVTPTPAATPPANLPPALVETQPPAGSILSLNGSLIFYFNQPMVENLTEAAFQMSPAVEGTFTWLDAATLQFAPDATLPAGMPLVVTINTGATASNGQSLAEAIQVNFQTANPLHVVETLPGHGSQDVDPTSAVVVVFDQPVVSLEVEPGSSPAAFTLEPAAAGQGGWLNTSTYIFYPDPPLLGGVRYTARLDEGLTGAMGSGLAAEIEMAHEFSFATALPQIDGVLPGVGQTIPLDAEFSLQFNQPMNQASVESHLKLVDNARNPVPAGYTWSGDGRTVTLTPMGLLQRDASYRLILDFEAEAAGGAIIGLDSIYDYTSVPNFSFIGSDPPTSQPVNTWAGAAHIFLEFSSPLASGQPLENLVRVTPGVPSLRIEENNDRLVLVSGFFEPGTSYDITLDASLNDRWGQALGTSQTLRFTTADAIPALALPALAGSPAVVFVPLEQSNVWAEAVNLTGLNITSAPLTLGEFIALAEASYLGDVVYTPPNASTWTQSLNLTRNQSQVVEVPLTQGSGNLTPGLYYFNLQANALNSEGYTPQPPFLAVASQTHLLIKRSATQALAWAVDMQTNTPLPGASVDLYGSSGQYIASSVTDAQGLCTFDLSMVDPYESIYAAIGQPGQTGFSLATDTWSAGITSWDFNIISQQATTTPFIYLYTDRPIYQPGDEVDWRAVLREPDNGRYLAPGVSQISVRMVGDFNYSTGARAVLDSTSAILSEYGTATGSFRVPGDAQPGYYAIEVVDGPSISFQVAEYRKPDIELDVSFPGEEMQAGENLEAEITAAYYFGAPAGNLAVSWSLFALPEWFEMPGGFQAGVINPDWDSYGFGNAFMPLGVFITGGEAETNPQGVFNLEIPANELAGLMENPGTQRLTLEVSVIEAGEYPSSARTSVVMHPADFYAGIRPETWMGQAGEELGFAIQTATWEVAPAPMRALHGELQEISWRTPGGMDAGAGMDGYVAETRVVSSVDFITDDYGRARIAFIPPSAGIYQVEVRGDGAVTRLPVWVGGQGTPAWPNLPNQHLPLAVDSTLYQAGDTAHVFIPNPLGNDTLALVTIERGRVMETQVLVIPGTGYDLALPLTGEHAPNVYLSVTLLGQKTDGSPDFRQGYVELAVQPVEQTLAVALAAQPETAEPGGQTTFILQVTDSSGNPVQGEFSLAVVDKAVLALAKPNSVPIVQAFYGQQPLGVTSSVALAAYVQRIAPDLPAVGGGGAGFPEQSVRQDFADTAYWNGVLITDADGMASVTLTLPDNLTTWVAEVRGLTTDTRVGQAEFELVTGKPLLIRPVVPRFLVAGDHAELAAFVHNNTSSDLTASVAIQVDGFTLDDPDRAIQTLTIGANSRERVGWWGIAGNSGVIELLFGVQAGELGDAARPENGSLPVLAHIAPGTFATSGVLAVEGERVEIISLPRSFTPAGGELRLEFTPTLGALLLDSLEAQEAFPVDYTEGNLSRLYPNLATYNALTALGLDSPGLNTRLANAIHDGMGRLSATQNVDGGWGWGSGMPSDPYLSAYVLLGFSRIQTGFAVDANRVISAQNYLISTLGSSEAYQGAGGADRQVFTYYALWESGRHDVDAGALFDSREALNPWGKALLALILQGENPADERIGTLLGDLESGAIFSAASVHWEDNVPSASSHATPNFVTAVVVYALARLNPASTLIPNAVAYLVANRQPSGAWSSSYESAWVITALAETMLASGGVQPAFGFSATLNGVAVASGQAGSGDMLAPVQVTVPLSSLSLSDPNEVRIRREAGVGSLYYRVYLQVERPVETQGAVNRGITIQRTYRIAGQDCGGITCTSLMTVGLTEATNLVAELTINVPHDMYAVVVEDAIPGGAEIVNPLLLTSQQGLAWAGSEEELVQGAWGWWYFNPPAIHSDRIRWLAPYLPGGTYRLTYRLTLLQAGEYHVLPAHAWQLHFPEVEGLSAGEIFTILP